MTSSIQKVILVDTFYNWLIYSQSINLIDIGHHLSHCLFVIIVDKEPDNGCY